MDKNTKRLAQEVAAYLITTGSTEEVNSLSRDIMSLRSNQDGIIELKAITAHEIGAKQLEEIKKLIKQLNPEATRIIVDQVLDPSVGGGVRLELPHQVLDTTVKTKLKRLKTLIA
jgi:F0F1-type ATP synthase delta subunit